MAAEKETQERRPTAGLVLQKPTTGAALIPAAVEKEGPAVVIDGASDGGRFVAAIWFAAGSHKVAVVVHAPRVSWLGLGSSGSCYSRKKRLPPVQIHRHFVQISGNDPMVPQF